MISPFENTKLYIWALDEAKKTYFNTKPWEIKLYTQVIYEAAIEREETRKRNKLLNFGE